jgi:hypothetical protein
MVIQIWFLPAEPEDGAEVVGSVADVDDAVESGQVALQKGIELLA